MDVGVPREGRSGRLSRWDEIVAVSLPPASSAAGAARKQKDRLAAASLNFDQVF